MNIEKDISSEINSIKQYIKEAKDQYDSGDTKNNNVALDYCVLFILVKNLTVDGMTYSTTAAHESIFNEAVVNFKYSVEAFANENVHIVATTKAISDKISTGDGRKYLIYEDIYDYLKKFSTVGLYDAVIVASAPCDLGGAVTTLHMFSYENILHGFTHIEIVSSDSSLVGHEYSNAYPHLTTTNFFIHEWLHQLEGYRNSIAEIYPDTHGYQDPTAYGYQWDTEYFEDSSVYPYIVEPYLSSFYRAVLAADITYNDSRKIGVFPLFWKVTPRKVLIGRYIIQNSSGSYFYNNSGSPVLKSSFANDMGYIWNVFYSISNSALKIQNFHNSTATISSTNYGQYTYARVGPYDEGDYFLVNLSLSDTVLGYTSSGALNMVAYDPNAMQIFELKYYSELYFSLSAKSLDGKYLDLNNNSNYEDNTVGLYIWTGYPDAQTWQYRFNGINYKIMPKKSPTRSLSFHDAALHITSATKIQDWRPELVTNGKFIHDGSYKIKTESDQYLKFSGNTLKLASSGTIWTFAQIEDNYYSISAKSGGVTYYFDVLNTYDFEGNIVQAQYATGYVNAQSWKLMLKNDGSIIIVPRVSLTRGIKSTTTGSTLSTSPTLFYLERL